MLIAGQVDNCEALAKAGFTEVVCINKKGIPLEDAMKRDVAFNNIKDALRLTIPR